MTVEPFRYLCNVFFRNRCRSMLLRFQTTDDSLQQLMKPENIRSFYVPLYYNF